MAAPRHLPSRFNGSEAAQRFARPRLGNLFGILAKRPQVAVENDRQSRIPPFIELLWLPAYAVCLKTDTKGVAGAVWAGVDAGTGHASLLEGIGMLKEEAFEGERLPARLTETDAIPIAREGVLRYVLRQRKHIGRPVIGEALGTILYYYPVWVLYIRRGKKLDLKVLDAYTGNSAGAKVRVAVLNALIAKKRMTTPT